MRAESKGEKAGADQNLRPRLFIVGQSFVLDLQTLSDPKRIALKKKLGPSWNAISAYPEGGALVVGAKGSIGLIP